MADNMTDSVLVVTDRLYTVLNAAKATFSYTVGARTVTLQDVWFGDGENDTLPRSPCLVVEPGLLRSPLAGVPSQVENSIGVELLLYHTTLNASRADSRRETMGLADVIRTWLHNNHLNLQNAGGDRIVIHGWVTTLEPGYAYKTSTLYNAVQMTWTGITKTRLKTT